MLAPPRLALPLLNRTLLLPGLDLRSTYNFYVVLQTIEYPTEGYFSQISVDTLKTGDPRTTSISSGDNMSLAQSTPEQECYIINIA